MPCQKMLEKDGEKVKKKQKCMQTDFMKVTEEKGN